MDVDSDLRVLTAGQWLDNLQEKAERFLVKIFPGLIGEQGLYDTINPITQMKNVEICETPPKYKTKNFLIIGTLNKIKISNLEKTLKWVKSSAKIILTCDDVSDPSSKGDFTLGMPKHILHMTNFNLQTTQAYSCGKPNPIVARKILEPYDDIKPEEVLLIGDTLYTDIRLAEENNFKVCWFYLGIPKEGIKSLLLKQI